MLKRIFIIALITGASQLFIVFALKFISHNNSQEQVRAIALIDSLVLFLINAIALGLQPATMRNIALVEEWKEEYNETQSARLALSLILASFSFLAFFNIYYLAFLAAPLFAMSGDYALYGRGHPVAGAIIAALRTILLFSLLIIFAVSLPESIAWAYLGGLFISYLMTNGLISKYLGTPFFSIPRWHNLKLYISTLPLGLVSLGLYFIGMGILIFAPYFYPSPVIAISFVGLKFYVIFKGILRIFHQAFIKDMINEKTCVKIDQMSSVTGIIFLGSFVIFPKSVITLFFGAQYIDQAIFFYLLGLAGLVYSLFLSMATHSMLLKKDKVYTFATVTAALITIISSIALSLFWPTATSIGISILLGELVWMIGLLKITGTFKKIQDRLFFAIQNLLILLIPVSFRYWLGDSLLAFAAGFGIFSMILLLLHYRKFKHLTNG